MMHVFGQRLWHDTVTIAGDKEDILRLKETLEIALSQQHASASFFPADGEEYTVQISCTKPDDMKNMLLPYTDEDARDTRTEAIKPLRTGTTQ